MTPALSHTPSPKPARTGLGWLLQTFTRQTQPPPAHDILFLATHRHPTSETFATSLIIGLWSLTASITLCLQSEILPSSVPFRCLIALVAWLVVIHLAVILPLIAYPLVSLALITQKNFTTLVEIAFLLFLTLIAWHLTTTASPLARSFGLIWLALMMAEAMLRLARTGIALASRPR